MEGQVQERDCSLGKGVKASQGHREDIGSRIDGWVLTASHAAWQKKKKKAARPVVQVPKLFQA